MAIIVIGGSTKDVGKTALVCGVIAALPEYHWTAVKITAHSYERPDAGPNELNPSNQIVWEEKNAGQGTDTARYLAAGARRALLVTRHSSEVPIEEIRRAVSTDRNIIFESNRIINSMRPDICLALVGGAGTLGSDRPERKESFVRLLQITDALVCVRGSADETPDLPSGILRFELRSLDRISPEFESWLRNRLNALSL